MSDSTIMESAPVCKECGQYSDFEARIASLLAFYGLQHNDGRNIEDYKALVARIRIELAREKKNG